MSLDIDLPVPIIKTKLAHELIEAQAIAEGLSPLIAGIVARRSLCAADSIGAALSPTLRQLTRPFDMADMDRAAARVAQAIIHQEYIGLETDHDCDGQTSHALLYHNLVFIFKHPADKVQSYIGHRLNEGYGLSQSVADRILAADPRPQLLITADNGSSDEARIAQLKAAGIEVIVSDHHALPTEGIPKSAYACLNPTRADCGYGDPYIAGCMVAWLLMAATRQKLLSAGYLAADTPTLMDSLDFVALGTVADCVSIARSINNRIVVSYGLALINQGLRPCWRAISHNHSAARLKAEDLAFKVAPLLNSDGRLRDAFGSLHFLLAEHEEEAMGLLWALEDQNAARKKIQKEIIAQGLIEAKKQFQAQKKSLCIYLADGHTGVHGVAASRIAELFGRPTIFLAPSVRDPSYISGSMRGIEGFHVRDALQQMADQHAGLFEAFGGHRAAGGLTLHQTKLPILMEAFEVATEAQAAHCAFGPVCWTDGALKAEDLQLSLLDALEILEPCGREFQAPIFEIDAFLRKIHWVGDGTHARLSLSAGSVVFQGIWFQCRSHKEAAVPVLLNQLYRVAFSLRANVYQCKRRLDVQIVQMQPTD